MIEPESEDESGEDVEDEKENDDDDNEGADSDRVSVASGISREQHSRLSIDTPGISINFLNVCCIVNLS